MKNLLLLKFVLLLVATSSHAQTKGFPQKNLPSRLVPTLVRGGTSGVGGGGNSLKGKLIENYMIDIGATEAYQKIANPLLTRIENNFSKGEYSKWFLKSLRKGSDEISWYFVPTELKELAESYTGLPFPSDQLAIQTTSGEVWIDENMFSRNNLTEQGRLIIHEILLRTSIGLNRSYLGNSHCNQDFVMKQVRLTTMFLFDSRTLELSEEAYINAIAGLGWFDFTCTSRYPKF